MGRALVGALAVVLVGATGCAKVQEGALDRTETLREATLTLPGRCAGVLLSGSTEGLTAAHCIFPGERAVTVALYDGTRLRAQVVALDETSDVAVLALPRKVAVRGLELATLPAEPGEELLFLGRLERAPRPQAVRVRGLGRCPSLPDVPDALFTSVRGEKGDSGAPLVDGRMRVVGLIHGGARCSIAAPTWRVAEALRTTPPQTGVGGAGSAGTR